MQFIEMILTSFILLPGIFILTLLLLAVVVIHKKKYKFIGGAIALIAISMYITSIPVFANYLDKHIDHVYKRQLPHVNATVAAVVFAGGSSRDENG